MSATKIDDHLQAWLKAIPFGLDMYKKAMSRQKNKRVWEFILRFESSTVQPTLEQKTLEGSQKHNWFLRSTWKRVS